MDKKQSLRLHVMQSINKLYIKIHYALHPAKSNEPTPIDEQKNKRINKMFMMIAIIIILLFLFVVLITALFDSVTIYKNGTPIYGPGTTS